jgi:hypothetical protein
MQKPEINDRVHYVAHGTPGGEYPMACRAAIVTEVTETAVVGLCVLNPTGQFFDTHVHQDDGKPDIATRTAGARGRAYARASGTRAAPGTGPPAPRP